jgi:hypothetical protein
MGGGGGNFHRAIFHFWTIGTHIRDVTTHAFWFCLIKAISCESCDWNRLGLINRSLKRKHELTFSSSELTYKSWAPIENMLTQFLRFYFISILNETIMLRRKALTWTCLIWIPYYLKNRWNKIKLNNSSKALIWLVNDEIPLNEPFRVFWLGCSSQFCWRNCDLNVWIDSVVYGRYCAISNKSWGRKC